MINNTSIFCQSSFVQTDFSETFFLFKRKNPFLLIRRRLMAIYIIIYRVFDIFSCPAHNFFLVWHWPTIFGTWVYHHKTMYHVHHDPDWIFTCVAKGESRSRSAVTPSVCPSVRPKILSSHVLWNYRSNYHET